MSEAGGVITLFPNAPAVMIKTKMFRVRAVVPVLTTRADYVYLRRKIRRHTRRPNLMREMILRYLGAGSWLIKDPVADIVLRRTPRGAQATWSGRMPFAVAYNTAVQRSCSGQPPRPADLNRCADGAAQVLAAMGEALIYQEAHRNSSADTAKTVTCGRIQTKRGGAASDTGEAQGAPPPPFSPIKKYD